MCDTADRERQYEIDRITFEYARRYVAWCDGQSAERPSIDAYMRQYPQFANELFEYALWLACEAPLDTLHGIDEPAELLPLSPAGEKALAAIGAEREREQREGQGE